MSKRMIIDENGLPVAFYDEGVHSNIPEDAIQIDDSQWLTAIENQGQVSWDGSSFVEYTRTRGIEEVRTLKLQEIMNAYNSSSNIGVDCTCLDGTTVITMDGGLEHAQTLKDGYDLAIILGSTDMDIVDFYDEYHLKVTLEDTLEIIKQQGTAARENWAKKVLLKRQILDATYIPEIEAISWT